MLCCQSAPDMKRHFTIVKEFAQQLDKNGFDLSKIEDKISVLRMLMKMADIGHVLKETDTIEWTRRINEVRSRGLLLA